MIKPTDKGKKMGELKMNLVSEKNFHETHRSKMEQHNFIFCSDEKKLLSGYAVFQLEYTGTRLGWQWSLSVYVVSSKDFNLSMNCVLTSGHYPELDDAKNRLITYLEDESGWLSNI